MAKYIFITGGVVSSLGKGILTAVVGSLLQSVGYKVCLRKLDPYLNVDPGTMSPYQHGEVFVTDDGSETDLDLGHYERFTGLSASRSDNITSGRIYQNIINKERDGRYLGETVQVIPHVTNEIKDFIKHKSEEYDFVLCEIGGTVGDIEGLPFFEAIRQFQIDAGPGNCQFIHMTLVPYLSSAGEIKTKPTQHSVKELNSIGIRQDMIVVRTEKEISEKEKEKISLFCNVHKNNVIIAPDCNNIYEVPLIYHKMGIDTQILKNFGLKPKSPNLEKWEKIVSILKKPKGQVNIAVVGKYAAMKDAYKSLHQALVHGGIGNELEVNINYVNSDSLEKELDISEDIRSDNYLDIIDQYLGSPDGVLVPGGFGSRGIQGKICAIEYARKKNIPFFGICLGMQLAVIEILHHVGKYTDLGSTEYQPNLPPENAVVDVMTRWVKTDNDVNEIITRSKEQDKNLGGTMRLGSYMSNIENKSKAYEIYKKNKISERHRHRYEIDKEWEAKLLKCGVKISGKSEKDELPEIMELIHHPWFIAVQYHPELKSRPFEPHPLFESFVKAAFKRSRLI